MNSNFGLNNMKDKEKKENNSKDTEKKKTKSRRISSDGSIYA